MNATTETLFEFLNNLVGETAGKSWEKENLVFTLESLGGRDSLIVISVQAKNDLTKINDSFSVDLNGQVCGFAHEGAELSVPNFPHPEAFVPQGMPAEEYIALCEKRAISLRTFLEGNLSQNS
jgi:hypothetical protein